MPKSPATPRRSRSKPRKTDAATQPADAQGDPPTNPARAATEEELAAIARAQQGHHSAESFWKAAGRFTKLR